MERFDVGVLLGRGGFAAVFRALERSTGRSVAIKMIAKQRLTDPGLAARLQREVALHSSLRHAHVVRLYEYFETVGAAACAAGAQLDPETDDCEYVCLVLEYCGGGDLRQLLQREGKLGEAAAKAVLRQICAGVAYLHESRVVHRDLKLANVLLCADGTVKICDFGVAATRGTFDQPEERWTLCGTPNYIAPEVVAGTEAHGTPADAWSIGCVAFALLTGSRAPHAARAAEELRTGRRAARGASDQPPHNDALEALQDDQVLRAKLSPEAADFVRRLLQRSPRARATVESICRHAFVAASAASDAGPSDAEAPSGWRVKPSSEARPGGWRTSFFDDWEAQLAAQYDGGPAPSRDGPGSPRSAALAAGAPHDRHARASHRLGEARPASPLPRRLSTARLGTFTSQRAQQSISIDAAGDATLELTKISPAGGDATAVCMTVSRDGRHVKLAYRTLRIPGGARDGARDYRVLAECELRALPPRYWPLYAHLGRAVELVRSRTPRVVIHYACCGGEAECALMENGPLPDVRVAWGDGAKARYSLRTARFELRLVGEAPLAWAPKAGGAPWPLDAPPQAYDRLQSVQRGVAACLRAAQQQATRRPAAAPHTELHATSLLLYRAPQSEPPHDARQSLVPPAERPSAPLSLRDVRTPSKSKPRPRPSRSSVSTATTPAHAASFSFVSDLTASTHRYDSTQKKPHSRIDGKAAVRKGYSPAKGRGLQSPDSVLLFSSR